jgi:hypothetical protein
MVARRDRDPDSPPGLILVLTEGSALAPFIYRLF